MRSRSALESTSRTEEPTATRAAARESLRKCGNVSWSQRRAPALGHRMMASRPRLSPSSSPSEQARGLRLAIDEVRYSVDILFDVGRHVLRVESRNCNVTVRNTLSRRVEL